MVRDQAYKAMRRAWLRDFRGMLKDVTIRKISSSATFDPVEEVWNNPETIEETVQGLIRSERSSLRTHLDVNLFNYDARVTVFKDDLEMIPTENDIVNEEFRIIRVIVDPADIFYQLYVRTVGSEVGEQNASY